MRMLLKGTDPTLFDIRHFSCNMAAPMDNRLRFMVFEEVFLFSLVRHVEPTDQNCLDLFYQRKESKNTAFSYPKLSKLRFLNFATYFVLFVSVEVLRPSQPSGVMSCAVSLPNHTFTGQA